MSDFILSYIEQTPIVSANEASYNEHTYGYPICLHCEFRRVISHVFANRPDQAVLLMKEAELARKLGLQASSLYTPSRMDGEAATVFKSAGADRIRIGAP